MTEVHRRGRSQECSTALVICTFLFCWFKVSQLRFKFVFYIYIYNSKSLDVVQSLYFGSKLPSSGTYIYVPDEGSLLPKYRDCTTSNDFELYLMCCGVMLQ